MNTKEGSTSELAQKKKREYNEFVFNVVNQLTLNEFKRYTNIRELMQNALLKRDEAERQKLDYYINQNFKQNIPKEILWKKGGFVSLKFKSYFYETDAAKRAFHNIFGTKICRVKLETIHVDEPQEAEMHLQVDIENHEPMKLEIGNVGLENYDKEIEKIDLTKDDSDVCMYPPKRRALKYPSKRAVNIAEFSGVVENVCETSKNLEEVGHTQNWTTAVIPNDEIVISSAKDTIPKKTIEGLAIICDRTVVSSPKTPLQKENTQQKFDSQSPGQSDTKQSENSTEVPSLLDEKRQVFNAQMSFIQWEFEKYLVTTPAFNWSLKHFWTEFLKLDHQNDCNLRDVGNVVDVNCMTVGDKLLQDQASVVMAEFHPTNANASIVQTVENSATMADIEMNLEKQLESNVPSISNASNVEINELAPDRSIEIANDSTQSPINNSNRNDSQKNFHQVDESYDKSGSTAPSTSEGILAPGDERLQNQSSIDIANDQPDDANVSIVHTIEGSTTLTDVEIKLEKMFESYGSDVEIIDVPPDGPIEIVDVSTQDLINNLELDRQDDSQDQANFVRLFAIPHQIADNYTKSELKAPSTSKRFLTALPTHINKKRIYKPLDIAVQSVKDIDAVILEKNDFSQQPDSISPQESYEIEEFTMTDSQIRRYELLNNENTLFVSSQKIIN